jgi:drug/metabolite transporter (DMT)-like permease
MLSPDAPPGSVFRQAHIRLFSGAALISLSPVWVKLTSVSPTTSGFYRVFIGGIALTTFLVITGKSLRFSRRIWSLLVVAAIFFSLDLWFWHRSIRFIGPGLSTLLANFQVFIMIFAGVLFLRQRPSLQQVIAVPLALVGLGLIIGLDWDSLPGDYQLGVVFGLATAVAYASYLLTMRVVREGAEHAVPIREIGTMSLMIAVILGTSAMVEGVSLAVPTMADFGWLLCYGLFSHGLGMMFIASSLPQVSTTEAGIALLLQPTLSFVWDVVFFARPMTPMELAGAGIALSAIYLGSRRSNL